MDEKNKNIQANLPYIMLLAKEICYLHNSKGIKEDELLIFLMKFSKKIDDPAQELKLFRGKVFSGLDNS